MSARDAEPLATLFHPEAVFVHMGAMFTKDEELNVIKTGTIHYRDIDIEDISVRFMATISDPYLLQTLSGLHLVVNAFSPLPPGCSSAELVHATPENDRP